MSTAATEVRWSTAGVDGPGLPVPSGQYRVGCVDCMHHLDGDTRGSLLLRLHYPTEAEPEEGYSYTNWYPHHRYIQGFFQYMNRDPAELSKITCKQSNLSYRGGGRYFLSPSCQIKSIGNF